MGSAALRAAAGPDSDGLRPSFIRHGENRPPADFPSGRSEAARAFLYPFFCDRLINIATKRRYYRTRRGLKAPPVRSLRLTAPERVTAFLVEPKIMIARALRARCDHGRIAA